MSDPLAPLPGEFRALARHVADRLAGYYDSLSRRPVVIPSTSDDLRQVLVEPLPQEGAEFGRILETVESVLMRYSRHNAHPRFFGYISSPGTPITAISAMMQAAWNINLTSWRSAPAAAEMEHVTIGWMKEMLGYPADAVGLYTSGGSIANLSALAAALYAKAPADLRRHGWSAVGRRMCVYVSEEGHYSIQKAMGLLGAGEDNVRFVRTNQRQEIDLEDLERQVAADRAAGHMPFCVVGNAGTTATGAFDDLGALADFARRNELWFHVDAAYGAFAALAPSTKHLFAHVRDADSVTLDPHKWLYLPVGCGCVLYKDPAAARAAFAHDAEYIRTIALHGDESFAFWDYGPELSRPFRAFHVWMVMKYAGAKRVGEAVERNIACAKHLERLVKSSGDLEMLADVVLSIFCFRVKPPADNEQILVKVNRGGSSYLSNAKVAGEFALRGCVLNYRTTERDMEILLDDVRAAAG